MRRSDETGGARMSSFLKPLSADGQSAVRRSRRDGMERLAVADVRPGRFGWPEKTREMKGL
jgi:hypothetical protein